MIHINKNQFLELEKIAIGAFSPLTGFMNEKEFHSVVNSMRLLDGSIFPLPVLLDITEHDREIIGNSKKIDLIFQGENVGILYPDDFYKCDRIATASRIYGTSSLDHPGVAYFFNLNPIFVGGSVQLLKRFPLNFSSYEFTPSESRKYFLDHGWKSIVGFQTRNAPHRAHEYLLRVGLELADGLFIQPLVGHKKKGDFTPEAILVGYHALIENYLPNDKVLLGTLSTNMRYAGPREAIFHAIIRRNYGCTHFIVGRDHAGVDDWYELYEAHALITKYEAELGIKILKLHGPYHCSKCDTIATSASCPHGDTDYAEHISGTYMRKILSDGEIPEDRFMRKEVVAELRKINCFIE